jgi:ubiquitin carboxyl-terminal hydrolase 8
MNKGLIGLKNRGNTCYLNTSIQCLSHLKHLSEYFLNNSYILDLNNRFNELKGKNLISIKITREYAKLITELWTNNVSINPVTFHEIIQNHNEQFSGFEQQDSQEILSFILDNLHEGLKYNVDIKYSGSIENYVDKLVVESIQNWKNNVESKYSIIADFFFGQFLNKVVSLENKSLNKIISKNFEMFNMLNIPIYGETIYESLNKYFEKEILETKYLDESTNTYINAYRQIKIMKVPKYLIIVLKRFKNNPNGSLIKSNNSIQFPIEELDMSPYSEGYDSINCNLKLISIGCHLGDFEGGHYYSICRHLNNKWYQYNDEHVSEFNINNKDIIFKYGYILIYEKIKND